MTEATRSTFLRRKLGVKLRRMRELAGMTLEEAAPLLDKKRSALQRIEAGETRADVHLVRTMMDEYNQYDPELLDEVRQANETPWYRVLGIKHAGYLDLETEASQVSQFLLIEIPGLLQTRAYMQALFRAFHRPGSIETSTQARSLRQERLTSEDKPLKLHTIVCEAALRRRFADPMLMQEQLQHLITMAALPTVTLQVLELSGSTYLPNAPFTLLTYPDPDDQDILYLEYPTGYLQIENSKQVEDARLVLEQLHIDALSPADSVALIDELARNQPWN
nr:helix-turn-helix transcriptional regulator [Kibdelosporangium sp. MJ126-NF4]CEL18801.1 Putative DNA-binding protein [Kibdelosporangium sp. MJ126-NF4]CTQ96346.1 Putative DNA-binding protein [Kibdelosporangium sp. MJ126-NF4]